VAGQLAGLTSTEQFLLRDLLGRLALGCGAAPTT
jgi:hypothetical protein